MALAPHALRFPFQRIAALDEWAMGRISSARTAPGTAWMRVITATPVWLSVMLCGLAAWADDSFLRGLLIGGTAAGIASVVVQVIKVTVRRERPSMAYCIVRTLDRYSFPSGHSCAAFAMATATLFAVPWLFPVALLLAGAVAFSRVYLGVHYPSDVLSGAVMGLVVGALTFSLDIAAGMTIWAAG
jgi:undecaprenyl-diphosphatase